MQAICNCGQVHTAQFPADVRATVQYGPRAQAAMVHLNMARRRNLWVVSGSFDFGLRQT
jgi:hypothetical protein